MGKYIDDQVNVWKYFKGAWRIVDKIVTKSS